LEIWFGVAKATRPSGVPSLAGVFIDTNILLDFLEKLEWESEGRVKKIIRIWRL
jgi:hypothetical protein